MLNKSSKVSKSLLRFNFNIERFKTTIISKYDIFSILLKSNREHFIHHRMRQYKIDLLL